MKLIESDSLPDNIIEIRFTRRAGYQTYYYAYVKYKWIFNLTRTKKYKFQSTPQYKEQELLRDLIDTHFGRKFTVITPKSHPEHFI